jgi:hypothetical protein
MAERMRYWLGGYLADDRISQDDFVVRPALGDRAGIVGAMLLAERAATQTFSAGAGQVVPQEVVKLTR